MKIIKWKLKIKNIDDIKKILIFSINRNSLINIVKEETNLFFYTIFDQEKILLQIDDIYVDLNLLLTDNKFEFKVLLRTTGSLLEVLNSKKYKVSK